MTEPGAKTATRGEGKGKTRLDWAKDGSTCRRTLESRNIACLPAVPRPMTPVSAKGSHKAGIALVRLLDHAGVSFGTLGTKESCCGDLADKIGAADVAADLTGKNTEMFLEAGVAKILTLSPHCLNSFKKDYEGLKKIPKTHFTELLDELIRNGAINTRIRVDLKVTYHDPCYLGRHSGIYEAPRRILRCHTRVAIDRNAEQPGAELLLRRRWRRAVERARWQREPWRGSDQRGHRDRRARMIATACPYCIRMLNECHCQTGRRQQDNSPGYGGAAAAVG